MRIWDCIISAPCAVKVTNTHSSSCLFCAYVMMKSSIHIIRKCPQNALSFQINFNASGSSFRCWSISWSFLFSQLPSSFSASLVAVRQSAHNPNANLIRLDLPNGEVTTSPLTWVSEPLLCCSRLAHHLGLGMFRGGVSSHFAVLTRKSATIDCEINFC